MSAEATRIGSISLTGASAALRRSMTWLMPIDATNPQPSASANNTIDLERMDFFAPTLAASDPFCQTPGRGNLRNAANHRCDETANILVPCAHSTAGRLVPSRSSRSALLGQSAVSRNGDRRHATAYRRPS